MAALLPATAGKEKFPFKKFREIKAISPNVMGSKVALTENSTFYWTVKNFDGVKAFNLPIFMWLKVWASTTRLRSAWDCAVSVNVIANRDEADWWKK